MWFFKRLLSRRSAKNTAPASIARRAVSFAHDSSIPRHWYRGWPQVTRFFDGLSLMFPLGEKIFIESVVHFRDQIATDVALSQAVQDFVYQEASHIREHRAYNQRLAEQGAPTEMFEQLLLQRKQRTDRFPPSLNLAMTASLEHLTAILSDQVLRNPGVLAGADPRMAELWRWHAIEETEHKAVAFDVLCAVVRPPFWRYWLRCAAMFSVGLFFLFDVLYFIYHLVRSDRQQGNWREWLRLQWWLWVNPGLFTRIIPAWLFWFVPGFHPNRLDSRALLQAARQAFDKPH